MSGREADESHIACGALVVSLSEAHRASWVFEGEEAKRLLKGVVPKGRAWFESVLAPSS